jgi:hypothetical protein
MATLTPRVKYTLDAAGQIGVQHANWDRADYVSGLIYRLSTDAPIDENTLFDGAVVVEKDTGISIRYLWNGSAFDKKYINYPMQYRAQLTGTFGNGTANASGWPTTDDAWNVNAKVVDWKDATSGIRIKVKALYDLKIHNHWQIPTYPTTSASDRDVSFFKNNVLQANYNYNKLTNTGWNSPSTIGSLSARLVLQVNDLINLYWYNNGGGSLVLTSAVELTLIRPVW